MALLINRAQAYSRIQIEDPDEIKHQRAQFLIYKSLQRADTRRKASWLKVRMFKLKIKIGKRLKNLRKGLSSSAFSAKADAYKQISCVLKSWKHLLNGKQDSIVSNTLPPMF